MDRFALLLRRAEVTVAGTALAVLVLSVLWGVLTRYVTERPAVWTTELSGILFTWVVFLGAATAFRDGRHIRVTMLVDLLPEALAVWVRRLGDALVLAFLIYCTWLSFVMMGKGATRPSPVMDIPFSYVYLACAIGFAVMSASAALRLIRPRPDTPAEDLL
ncbi:TRAP transporter small permease [Jannaschia sp. M317]|uniref:TRAP transporter small permease n=1 Tax=Jannaschia sp. M317 TaxID=2867011 RepID=UPI0021A872CE|nr:TRAP transporter small permease [Jannaschia sp. M317]UWQ19893.1 TRAP transporter small permease [Jannaschia sp. M317]